MRMPTGDLRVRAGEGLGFQRRAVAARWDLWVAYLGLRPRLVWVGPLALVLAALFMLPPDAKLRWHLAA